MPYAAAISAVQNVPASYEFPQTLEATLKGAPL